MSTLLVASTGGHLMQLFRLKRMLPLEGPFLWVTFDTPQSRSLLEGEDVRYVPFVAGRDPRNVMRNVPHARRILRDHSITTVVSTGSAVAIPYFAVARMHRRRAIYIESAARALGPSVSARIISTIPGVELYCQYPAWSNEKWRYGGSVFDVFEAAAQHVERPEISRAVVTLGTYKDVDFGRLLRRLVDLLPSNWEILWQTGDTDASGFPIEAHRALPSAELSAAMANADVVIAHAGVGSALAALELGKAPVLAPRRHSFGEAVDDHQVQVAHELDRRGLAVVVDADELELRHLHTAAGMAVEMREDAPRFALRD